MRQLLANTLIPVVLAAAGCAQVPKPATPIPAVPTAASVTDGPHLFHQKDGSVVAKWIIKGKVQERRFAKGKPVELPEFAHLLGEKLPIVEHKPDPGIWKMPERLFVISDIEGEYDSMLAFLRANKVVDAKGHWSFAKGHLVCVGDMVDRGTQVTETLWLIHRLYREAKAAGGFVHFVLGNHEVMMMGGDVRYTAPKYKLAAQLLRIPTKDIVGADQEIGRFLRTRNVMVRIGELLFVHAGVSEPVMKTGLTLDKLNQIIRPVLGVPPMQIQNPGLQGLVWGRVGPLWYRGYFKMFELDFGPVPSAEVLDKILAHYSAKTVIIGHTKVQKIAYLHGKRRVLPIDIPWTDLKKVRGLSVQGDKIDVVDYQGKATPLR